MSWPLPLQEHGETIVGRPQKGTGIFIHGGYWMAAPA